MRKCKDTRNILFGDKYSLPYKPRLGINHYKTMLIRKLLLFYNWRQMIEIACNLVLYAEKSANIYYSISQIILQKNFSKYDIKQMFLYQIQYGFQWEQSKSHQL